MPKPGLLTIAAAPIGNPADASRRLAEALGSADIVAAEDTRRVRRLAADLGVRISGQVRSYYDSVEQARTPGLLRVVRDGGQVLLVTDSGMPTVADPGFRVIQAAAAEGLPVSVLPGPSAVTAALAVSGLPTDRFCFEGFLPRKPGARHRAIAELAGERRTMVILESPRRILVTLQDLADGFGGDRAAVVCRELTKTHEEVLRADLGRLVEWARTEPRGEITLVVAGAGEREPMDDPAALAEAVATLLGAGTDKKSAVAEVARDRGVPKRVVYQAVLDARA